MPSLYRQLKIADIHAFPTLAAYNAALKDAIANGLEGAVQDLLYSFRVEDHGAFRYEGVRFHDAEANKSESAPER